MPQAKSVHPLQILTIIDYTALPTNEPSLPEWDGQYDKPRWLSPNQVRKRRGHWLWLAQGGMLARRADPWEV